MSLKKLGTVTIGQAPRKDITPILEKYIGDRAELIQVGVLDGMTRAEVEPALFPESGDEVLTSTLLTGEAVILSGEKIKPLLGQKISELEQAGCQHILVLCTGSFEGLTTQRAILIQPDALIQATLSTLLQNRKLGVIMPLIEQQTDMDSTWGNGVEAVYASASPYTSDQQDVERAADDLLRQGADLILLDCMGYTEATKCIVEAKTKLPVILSSSFMAKIVSELY